MALLLVKNKPFIYLFKNMPDSKLKTPFPKTLPCLEISQLQNLIL